MPAGGSERERRYSRLMTNALIIVGGFGSAAVLSRTGYARAASILRDWGTRTSR